MGKGKKNQKQKQKQSHKENKEDKKLIDDNFKDISCDKISITVPNLTLLDKTNLLILNNHRYGLMGINGCGKSTLLKHIALRKLPIPANLDILYIEQEIPASSELTVFQTVYNSNQKLIKILSDLSKIKDIIDEDVLDELLDHSEEDELNMELYEKLQIEAQILGCDRAEGEIRSILHGLGFTIDMQNTTTNMFSGGWRMRISLAQGLYLKPNLLILDEPTNHLDAEATIWLTNYLSKWKNTLLVVSHDRNFLDDVCTDIIHLRDQKLFYYSGNFTMFQKQRSIEIAEYFNAWNKLQNEVTKLRKASTKREIVNKLISDSGLTKPPKDYTVHISFGDPADLKGDLIQVQNVDFGYVPDKMLFTGLDFKIDFDTRITLVGANGVGKSTLLKLLANELIPSNFEPDKHQILFNHRLKIGYFHQHSGDILPLQLTPIEYLMTIDEKLTKEDCHVYLGTIGLSGKQHTQSIESLSGGQKARVAFAGLQASRPNLLLLDEPTNHLDIESILGLIKAIQNFSGAVVMITHDISLINETHCRLWELCDHKIHETNYDTYKQKILTQLDDTAELKTM
jgi:ATP-binding cassette subfamily F protein 1